MMNGNILMVKNSLCLRFQFPSNISQCRCKMWAKKDHYELLLWAGINVSSVSNCRIHYHDHFAAIILPTAGLAITYNRGGALGYIALVIKVHTTQNPCSSIHFCKKRTIMHLEALGHDRRLHPGLATCRKLSLVQGR